MQNHFLPVAKGQIVDNLVGPLPLVVYPPLL